MIERMKSRVTLSLDPTTVEFLTKRAGTETKGNLSALVDQLARDAALRESVSQHAEFFNARPEFFDDAEAELAAALGQGPTA